MKRHYGVESMLRLLSGDNACQETHNALFDAMDELEIMRLPDPEHSRIQQTVTECRSAARTAEPRAGQTGGVCP